MTDNERRLFSAEEISVRVDALAKAIVAAPEKPDIVVPVLVGAFVFAADLMRALSRHGLDVAAEFIWLHSYGTSEAAGDVTVLKGPTESAVRGKTVLLIDGVLDFGATLSRAHQLLTDAGARAIVTAVLVEKPHPTRTFKADHVGFKAGADFLYGYGMDRAGLSRGLPDVRVKT